MSSHTFAVTLVVAVWLSVALTVAVDATRRGRYGGVWGVTTVLLGPLGLLIYALVLIGAAARPDTGGDGDGDGNDSDDGDTPPRAGVVRSGARGYCDDCGARVSFDADRCPDCGAVFR